MQTTGTFEVTSFEAVDVPLDPPVETALPLGVARLTKAYSGAVSGRSTTLFTSAYDGTIGSYVAMDAFDGSLDGRTGAFAYLHSASTGGADRSDEYLRIVEGSGTGELAGIRGAGRLHLEGDGTHRVTFDYDLA